MTSGVKSFQFIYKLAKGDTKKLPWAHDEPTPFLAEIMDQYEQPGRALDMGCGSGVDSVAMGKRGWNVTSIDFVENAVNMTKERARREGVELTVVQADMTKFKTTDKYDLVLDIGLLHNLPKQFHAAYRRQLMSWLKPGGDLLAVHHFRRKFFEFKLVGPRREYREYVINFYAPECTERDFRLDVFEDQPWIVGWSVPQATYWFKRTA